ncbi:hypothetical protein [Candidatus Methylomicrobium oryzae]|jgi:hypothetical protein|nr:hypothetical protein [Methylomicrobium sp. RS1]
MGAPKISRIGLLDVRFGVNGSRARNGSSAGKFGFNPESGALF